MLRRKVQDPRRHRSSEEVWLSKPNLFGGAARHIVLVHVRETLLELKRDALTHHTRTVHGIHERLRFRLEQVTSQHPNHQQPYLMPGPLAGRQGVQVVVHAGDGEIRFALERPGWRAEGPAGLPQVQRREVAVLDRLPPRRLPAIHLQRPADLVRLVAYSAALCGVRTGKPTYKSLYFKGLLDYGAPIWRKRSFGGPDRSISLLSAREPTRPAAPPCKSDLTFATERTITGIRLTNPACHQPSTPRSRGFRLARPALRLVADSAGSNTGRLGTDRKIPGRDRKIVGRFMRQPSSFAGRTWQPVRALRASVLYGRFSDPPTRHSPTLR